MRPVLVLILFVANLWALASVLDKPGRGTIRAILLIVFVPGVGILLHRRRRAAVRTS